LLDPVAQALFRDGKRVRLTPKAAAVLTTLVQQAGQVVTKEQLLAKIWPDAIVEEGSLTQAVSQLRKALGESEGLIETVPKHGYLFVGQVTEADDPPGGRQTAAPSWKSWGWRAAVAVPLIAAVAIAVSLRSSGTIRIAVMPFEDVTPDQSAKYLGRGMTDEITALLGNISPDKLSVVWRNSARKYRGPDAVPKGPSQIGRELAADYILDGSLTTDGDNVRLALKLIRTEDSVQVWARSFQRNRAGLFKMQSDIAQAVAEQVSVRLDSEGKQILASARDLSPSAVEAYMRGISNPGQAQQLFREVIEKEPAFAPAYWRLADTYFWSGFFGALPPLETFPKAKEFARKAIELDPASAEALASVAMTQVHYDWKFSEADVGFQQALGLSPSQADVRHGYSHYLLAMSRPQDSLSETKLAVNFNPADDVLRACIGWHDTYAGDYEDGIKQARQAMQMNPKNGFARMVMGWNYEQAGKPEEAIGALKEAVAMGPGVKAIASLAHAYAQAGRRAEAEELLNQLLVRSKEKYTSPYDIATVYAGLGDWHNTMIWLEAAYEKRDGYLVHAHWDPRFKLLLRDSRFRELMKKIGLPV
jgi:DNA-binding winged helix-turn-helix (wHTH) protein/TolB-like protein/Tfp pilus assembly protein PilF